MEGTRKHLRVWFRAIWDVVSRKPGISAKDLQRVMGFGSYKTAWSWRHKIRRCLVRPESEPLRGSVHIDEGFLGGRSPGRRGGRSIADKCMVDSALRCISLWSTPVGDGRADRCCVYSTFGVAEKDSGVDSESGLTGVGTFV